MKLATEIRWQDSHYRVPVERIRLTERCGYDALFTAEGNGSDAFTPLGYAAAITSRLQLGTCIAQVTGRSPAATTMQFQTLHHMSGGRVIAGLGSTNPNWSEALHGRPWGNPVARMRDFVTVLRQGLSHEPLAHTGPEITVPLADRPPAPTVLTDTPGIPIVIAAGGRQMISLAAEIGDGWFPVNFAPGMFGRVLPLLQRGFDRAGNGKSLAGFDIWAHVDVMVDDDVRTAMRPFKEYVVRYAELQREIMIMRGYPDLNDELCQLKAAGRADDAVAVVPDEYVDDGWLVGPLDRIVRRLEPWLDCGATGLIIRYGPQGQDLGGTEPLEVFEAIARSAR
jgi:alkanesulfonate monooxygenase SsuD/methylene tetrahydromethanopterin reductase-like flavin-dependent oxidoreductase (luciferase family)